MKTSDFKSLALTILLTVFSCHAEEVQKAEAKAGDGKKLATKKTTAAKDEPPPVSKWGIRDVEVQLTDNSTFRGELDGVDAISLKTSYGVLTIPCGDILRVQRGTRINEKVVNDIGAAIKALDSEEFAKRTTAQQKLETCGVEAIDLLKKAREAGSPEMRTRIDKILAKLNEKFSGKGIQTEDIVSTVRFDVMGTLQLDSLKLASRVGPLSVNIEDLHSIRWLGHGDYKTLSLDPNGGTVAWVDTGITLNNNDQIAIVATGSINPSPNNNNLEIGPMGTENWGANGGFMMGTLLGKLGTDGEPFAIGQGKAWASTSRDRLYLKIFWNSRQCRIENGAKGAFKIKIHTGSLAEGVKIPKTGVDDADGQEPNLFKN